MLPITPVKSARIAIVTVARGQISTGARLDVAAAAVFTGIPGLRGGGCKAGPKFDVGFLKSDMTRRKLFLKNEVEGGPEKFLCSKIFAVTCDFTYL